MRVRLITKQELLANIAWNIFGIFHGVITLYKPHRKFLLVDENNSVIQTFDIEQEAINYCKFYEYELL